MEYISNVIFADMEDAKGWEDSAEANNSKSPSFSVGFCYRKNSASTADPPKQDIGCPLGDFGITLFTHSPPRCRHENVDCISLWQSMPILEDKVIECATPPPDPRFLVGFFPQTILLYPSILTCGFMVGESLSSKVTQQVELEAEEICMLCHHRPFKQEQKYINYIIIN